MIVRDLSFNMRFNSFVRDTDFYEGKMNSLARFDALAEHLKYTARINCGDDYIHCISEQNFQALYKATLTINQNYFVLGTAEEWETYFMKNNFSMMHGTLLDAEISKVKNLLK